MTLLMGSWPGLEPQPRLPAALFSALSCFSVPALSTGGSEPCCALGRAGAGALREGQVAQTWISLLQPPQGSELIPGQLTAEIREVVLCVNFSQSAFHLGVHLVWAGVDP